MWLAFGACALAVGTALAYVTLSAVRLEQREAAAQAEARLQTALRLALWRMDSAVAPLVAQEAARPYTHYAPHVSAEPEADRTGGVKRSLRPASPSPLAEFRSEFLRLHFEIGEDGQVASPQVAAVGAKTPAVTTAAEDRGPPGAAALLARLGSFVDRARLLEAVSRAAPNGTATVVMARSAAPMQTAIEQQQSVLPSQQAADFSARQQLVNVAQNVRPLAPAGRPDAIVVQGGFVPVWCADTRGEDVELVLARVVTIGSARIVQGVWVDWPRLRQWLLDGVHDLLVDARLEPVTASRSEPAGGMLATVPAVLSARSAADESARTARFAPIRLTLAIAWSATLAAVTAVGLVLRAAMRLGERRLQFASAVTHELRTPLTTFRMYSEMLAEGMVREEEARREYLATLAREAQRLCGVVENVLLYARIEQNRAATRLETLTAGELLDRVRPRLERRAADGGMTLDAQLGDSAGARIRTDCQAVEQILYNLVDNACKYACDASDRRLYVNARVVGRVFEVSVRDHGPGIPASERRRVFEPFHRGGHTAGDAASGVGLGLALALGLARELGGDLRLAPQASPGATFVLRLPLAV